MAKPKLTPERIEHDDCRRIATVLEGVAGKLREGGGVREEDVRAAAETAEWIWQAGPKPRPEQAREFEAAHAHLVRAAAGCGRGAPKESAQVESAAFQAALALRRMGLRARELSARKELPAAIDERLAALGHRYAAYAIHPAAA